MNAQEYVKEIATAARAAWFELAGAGGAQRDSAILACAQELRKSAKELQQANAKDLDAGRQAGLSDAMLDRLKLGDKEIEKMAKALEAIAAQVDPVGQTIAAYNRPSGLRVEKRRVPLGVVAIIYESRPNVTTDAAGLCLKSGNACILRGGKESIHSNVAIGQCVRRALKSAGLNESAVTLVETIDRQVVTALAQAQGLVDLIIPRGGESLIRAVVEAATIPVLKHYTGNCHVYVDEQAGADMAREIVLNSKCQRPGVCNAAEHVLVHRAHAAAGGLLGLIVNDLLKAGVEVRGDAATQAISPQVKAASEQDWHEEYLDKVIGVKVVGSLDEAVAHINKYGSHHTDAIVTDALAPAQRFVTLVDSSSVMVNASTRFSDGGEYGLGAEIGISTDKLHARGPMGAEDLTTYKWVVTGNGHLRT